MRKCGRKGGEEIIKEHDVWMKNLTHDVLKKLFQSNEHFREDHDASFFNDFKDAQNPRYTFLTCSDSRIPHIDPMSQNDGFVVRNIGNQILGNLGSITFGVSILKTPVLFILGHSRCGAVEGALKGDPTGHCYIDSELKALNLQGTDLKEAVLENIHAQVARALDMFSDRINSGDLTVVGGLYDFAGDWGESGTLYLVDVNGLVDTKELKEKYQGFIPELNFLKL